MASAAQCLANKANAQHSKGPRTETGKASASLNARTHGLAGKSFVILPGQEAAFTAFEASLHAEFQPTGIYQDILFQQILHASWNLQRCRKAEAQLHAESADPAVDPLLVDANASKLRLIATYASRAERSLSRAVKELRAVQTEARYRAEEGITDPQLSPLVETQHLDRQTIANKAKIQQAALTQVRAFCEVPTPSQLAAKFGPAHLPGQSKPNSIGDLLLMTTAFGR